jgi:hypothetical protein
MVIKDYIVLDNGKKTSIVIQNKKGFVLDDCNVKMEGRDLIFYSDITKKKKLIIKKISKKYHFKLKIKKEFTIALVNDNGSFDEIYEFKC